MKSGRQICIYTIKHVVTGKTYVGSTTRGLSRRKIEHWRDLRRGNHSNIKLQRAWNKYGEDYFVFAVLEFVPDAAQVIAQEQFWIDRLNAVDDGYNLAPTAKSLLGFKHSIETREQMSKSATGKKKSPEHVAKYAAALRGRKMTPEQCEKMRIAKLGKKRAPHSEATKAKIAAAHKGRKLSDEHCAALSVAAKARAFRDIETTSVRCELMRVANRTKYEARCAQKESDSPPV